MSEKLPYEYDLLFDVKDKEGVVAKLRELMQAAEDLHYLQYMVTRDKLEIKPTIAELLADKK